MIVERFEANKFDYLPFLISELVKKLFFNGYSFWGRWGVKISDETVLGKLINTGK